MKWLNPINPNLRESYNPNVGRTIHENPNLSRVILAILDNRIMKTIETMKKIENGRIEPVLGTDKVFGQWNPKIEVPNREN